MKNTRLQLFFPFLNWIPELRRTWKSDLLAGLIGGVVVLPQGVAFAMIAGMPPQFGLYAAAGDGHGRFCCCCFITPKLY